ncbi:MAG: hypothetical protein ACLTR6_01915 [Clostridium fessum]
MKSQPLLIDYKRLNSDAWFDYEVQKMCSIAASMTTMAFNRYFAEAAATDNGRRSVCGSPAESGSERGDV